MMNKIFSIVNKNLRLFARLRSSSLVIFLGPLLIVLLVGAAFTNTQFLINVGVYAEKYTTLTDSVVSKMSTSQFKVTKLDSEDLCINSVKAGTTQICIVFPKDFEIKEGRTNDVLFYIDFSRINLVYMVLDVISGRVGERSREISTSLTQDLLDKVRFTQDTLAKDKPLLSTVLTDIELTDAAIADQARIFADLDLSLNKDAFKLNDLAAKVASTKGALTDAIAALDELKSDIDKSNLTDSEKSSMKADIDSAKTDIQDALNAIEGTNASAASKLVESARTALDELDARLKTAATKRTQLVNEIATLREKLGKDIGSLKTVIGDMDEIIKRLESLQIANATQIVTPISTVIKPVTVERSFFSLAFPTLLVLFAMVTGILLSSTMVIVEKRSVSYFRNAITPTTDLVFNVATYLTGLLTMFVQVFIFVLIASFLFTINILPAIPVILLIVLLMITFFVFTGMIIGFIFRSEETGTLASISVSSIFLFFSSVVLPLETLPPVVKSIADMNPFVIAETMLRQALLFKFGFRALGSELLIFLLYVVVLFGLLIGLQKLAKSHYIFHRHKSDKK